MIHLKQNIKQEDAQWVLEFVMPKQGWRIDRTTLGYVADAHNKIFEEQVGVSGCSCEFVAQHGVWYSRLNQYRSQIEAVAYPPVSLGINEENIVVEAITEIQTLPNEIRVKTRKKRNA